MRIFLARHGETIWNAARIMQFPDTPLSERGLLQAEALGERLAGEPIAAVLASDYRRAVQTAEAVARHTGAPLATAEVLRERNFGVHRGQPLDGFAIDVFAADHHPPGGESVTQFQARVARAWQHMVAAAGSLQGDLVVVSHALLVRAVIERHLSVQHLLDGRPLPRLPNTAVTLFDRAAPHAVHLLGSAEHLLGDALPDARNHPAGI